MLPQLAQGDANKIFIIPSEFTQALANLGGVLGSTPPSGDAPRRQPHRRNEGADAASDAAAADAWEAADAARAAEREASAATTDRRLSGGHDAGQIGAGEPPPTPSP
jgi:hypothetical protein